MSVLCQTPFTRYNRLSIRFDNRLYRVNKHPTGCQTGCQTGLTTVLNEQLFVQHGCETGLYNRFDNRLYTRYSGFVKPVVKQVWQPVECLYTRYNRLSYLFDNRLYRVRVNGALAITFAMELTFCRPFCICLFSGHILRWRSVRDLDLMWLLVQMGLGSRQSCVEFVSDLEESQAFWVVQVQWQSI